MKHTLKSTSPNHIGATFSTTSASLPKASMLSLYRSATPPESGSSSWMIISVSGGSLSIGVSFGKLGVIPIVIGWSGLTRACSSYSHLIFSMTPRRFSSNILSPGSEDLSETSSAFSSLAAAGFSSVEVRRSFMFLGNAILKFFPNSYPLFFSSLSSVGEVGEIPGGPSPGVAGALLCSEEASD